MVLTLSSFADRLRDGSLPQRAVALTFDDAFASVVSEAAPRLRRRGWPATIYCVADYLGGSNDWPTQPVGAPRRPLASPDELAELAASGFELGAHTLTHPPLSQLTGDALQAEVVGCKRPLERLAGRPIRTFACPYGEVPGTEGRRLLEGAYSTVCTTALDRVRAGADPYALPRVDAHYVRNPALLARVLRGSDLGYLAARRAGARARRLVFSDSA